MPHKGGVSVCSLTSTPFSHTSRGGGVPEWLKGTDCKSVGARLRWFESNPLHHSANKINGLYSGSQDSQNRPPNRARRRGVTMPDVSAGDARCRDRLGTLRWGEVEAGAKAWAHAGYTRTVGRDARVKSVR